MLITVGETEYLVSEKYLKSIYFRAPIFLRELPQTENNLENVLYKEQWMSFIRNLLIFENVLWANNPEKTYKAENKIVQLKYAKKIGFSIPNSTITNYTPELHNEKYIIKSLDTAFFNIDGNEGFIYSNIIDKKELQKANLQWAPVIIQDYIYPKTDIRVTVVGNEVFATDITINGKGLDIDWRKAKDDVKFNTINLPNVVKNNCIEIVKQLGLKFGAIDLLKTDKNDYVFLEINPTGEWAWLVHTTGQPIPQSFAKMLVMQ
jgi:glutathione synthase/RimK-type ligase-like ATP-grasp enzyme